MERIEKMTTTLLAAASGEKTAPSVQLRLETIAAAYENSEWSVKLLYNSLPAAERRNLEHWLRNALQTFREIDLAAQVIARRTEESEKKVIPLRRREPATEPKQKRTKTTDAEIERLRTVDIAELF